MRLSIPEAYDDLIEHFGVYLKLLHFGGMPLLDYSNNRICYIYQIISLFNMLICVVGMSADVAIHLSDLSRVIENARVSFLLFLAVWSWYILQ